MNNYDDSPYRSVLSSWDLYNAANDPAKKYQISWRTR